MVRSSYRVLALVVLVLLAALSWAGYRYLTVQQTGEVAIPADEASPEQVVRAYVEALDAHDCDTAVALNPDDQWCDDVESMKLIELRSVHSARARHVELPARLDFEWRPFFFDVSMDDGRISWGFILERDGPREPWRILDQGVG